LLDYLEPALGETNGPEFDGTLAAWRSDFSDVSQQEAGSFQRYRVADSNTLQVIFDCARLPGAKVYQNREIQDLFSRFRTMKSFVGRDQLRETLFIK